MIAWVRTFVRRHLIADDPWPQYSHLDQVDGLSETPLSQREELAEIDARLTGDRNASVTGVEAQSVRDRAYLLALVREQAAKLDAVAGLVEQAEKSGNGTLYANDVHAAIAERAAA
ncbi:hypothetical protein QFZ79_000717 [Arthrobacter sp. V4I6]|uniref:hypothetical protein n=1 Tax=unclassified Arthrobacter TaxID=235627 RepID=UPI00278AD0F1|nr:MULTISPECIES: hypothetical protein [unclassified Arthrobacter]MDQ0822978.1 hypothetical protein [Arthrobacter sp. V1I7]MDQ0852606.1 hypothetical protein [Arthrobacter sp. V4I6]